MFSSFASLLSWWCVLLYDSVGDWWCVNRPDFGNLTYFFLDCFLDAILVFHFTVYLDHLLAEVEVAAIILIP